MRMCVLCMCVCMCVCIYERDREIFVFHHICVTHFHEIAEPYFGEGDSGLISYLS